MRRSHEVLAVLADRAQRHREYYRSGAKRYGAPGGAREDYPFRILMIFKSAQRRDNLARTLLSLPAPILTQVMVATFSDAFANPLGRIWFEPPQSPRSTSTGGQPVR